MNPRLIAIIGPSGAGKSTVVKVLCEKYGFQHIKSITSRPKRDDLDDDHIFVSEETFESMKKTGSFFGVIEAFNHQYGLPRFSPFEKSVVLLRAPAVKEFLSQFPYAEIVEIDAAIAVLQERLIKRNSFERYDPVVFEKEITLGRSVAHRTVNSTLLSIDQVVEAVLQQ